MEKAKAYIKSELGGGGRERPNSEPQPPAAALSPPEPRPRPGSEPFPHPAEQIENFRLHGHDPKQQQPREQHDQREPTSKPQPPPPDPYIVKPPPPKQEGTYNKPHGSEPRSANQFYNNTKQIDPYVNNVKGKVSEESNITYVNNKVDRDMYGGVIKPANDDRRYHQDYVKVEQKQDKSVCFVCGAIGHGEWPVYARPEHAPPGEPHYPFLEQHTPPAGWQGGTRRCCRVCRTLLKQQWDTYERESRPHAQRMYWLKRIDGKPFTGTYENDLSYSIL